MTRAAVQRWVAGGAAVVLLVGGFAAGRLTAPLPRDGSRPPLAVPTGTDEWLPAVDVPGNDIAGLPRFPGSVRVDYDRQGAAGLIVTDVDYLTGASMVRVQRFYREGFDPRGWKILDVGFVRGEWSFLLRDGATEVTVQIARRGPLVEVDIEQSRPSKLPSPVVTPACRPAPSVAVLPQPVGSGSRRCESPG